MTTQPTPHSTGDELDEILKSANITSVIVEYGSDGQKRYLFDIASFKATVAALLLKARIDGATDFSIRIDPYIAPEFRALYEQEVAELHQKQGGDDASNS